MAHMALYRKWRPLTFEDVVEQRHIVTTLKNSIKNNTVSHAYLFCGTRGTGKTTLAKIFARAVNCTNPSDGSPCNECFTCKGILDGSIIDVIEIDAASNNGVDDVREIKEAVMYVPAITRYKVYIIDEVHMLTTGAFNAFLKTLEEPPSHVIFILATTDPQKLPNTILSRCQRFDLKRITVEDIVKRLAFICEQESIALDPEHSGDVLDYIARQVDGGMRDAIKLLQKCTSLDEVITVQTVVDALGSVNEVHLKSMTDFLLNKDLKNTITYFNQLVSDGIDVKMFLADMVEYLKDSMTEDISNEKYDIDKRMYLADGIIDVLANLRNATQVKTLTELSLIKMCHEASTFSRIREVEKEIAPSEKRQEVNQIIQGLEVDPDALQQVIQKMTALEKRMMVNEMAMDALKYQRR